MGIRKMFLIVFVILGLSFVCVATAQEYEEEPNLISNEETTVTEDAGLDTEVRAEDLDLSTPILLPNSPFYFMKDWARSIRELVTRDPLAKLELKERYANERLLELREMVQNNVNEEAIQKAIEKYEKELEKVKTRVEDIKEKAEENPKLEEFLDKFVDNRVLGQKILNKLENQVSVQNTEQVQQIRQKHLEQFGEIMTKLEQEGEKIQQRLEERLEAMDGSKYKEFKNLEVLKELKGVMPEANKQAIGDAAETTLNKLKENFESMSPEDQENLQNYLEKIGGIKETQVEILEELKSELKDNPDAQKNIIQSRDRILQQVQQEMQKINREQTQGQPEESVQERAQEQSQEQKQACITQWDPICGSDGRTYSNKCFAETAGVQVKYTGKCIVENTNESGTEIPLLKSIREKASQNKTEK